MYTVAKIGAGISVLTLIGISSHFINDSLAERINSKLKGFKVGGKKSWEKKIRALKLAKKEEVVSDLYGLKKADEIQWWCEKNQNAYLKSINDLRFKNVQTYCIYNNWDKLPDKAISADGKWDTIKAELKGKSGLSPTMEYIKAELTNQKENALRDWCLEYYKSIWEDSQNEDFKDASSYCIEKTG